jgi:hypothetical protein
MTEEDKVPQRLTQAYRELGAPNPPEALDEAILAASRRPPAFAVGSWTRRWAVPLSLAAVLVLSVTVTLRMQYEQPGIEAPTQVARPQVANRAAPASPAPPAAEAQLRLKVEEEIKPGAVAPSRERPAKTAKAERPSERERQPEPKPFADQRRDQVAAAAPAPAAPPAPAAAPALSSRADSLRSAESSVTGGAARQMEERTARDVEAAARAPQAGPVQALAKRGELANLKAALDVPERELERIAQLRREGRHEEADKALADFRKRHPDYRIPDAMRERVERR